MFSYRAVLLWNSLPNDIQDSPTFYVFKLKLKNIFYEVQILESIFLHYFCIVFFTNFFLPQHFYLILMLTVINYRIILYCYNTLIYFTIINL